MAASSPAATWPWAAWSGKSPSFAMAAPANSKAPCSSMPVPWPTRPASCAPRWAWGWAHAGAARWAPWRSTWPGALPPAACACTWPWASASEGQHERPATQRFPPHPRSEPHRPGPEALGPSPARGRPVRSGPAGAAPGPGRGRLGLERQRRLAGHHAEPAAALAAGRPATAAQRRQRHPARGGADRRAPMGPARHPGHPHRAAHPLGLARAAEPPPGPERTQRRAPGAARQRQGPGQPAADGADPAPDHRHPAATRPDPAARPGRPGAEPHRRPLPLRRRAAPPAVVRAGRGCRPLQRPGQPARRRPHGPDGPVGGRDPHRPGRPGPGATAGPRRTAGHAVGPRRRIALEAVLDPDEAPLPSAKTAPVGKGHSTPPGLMQAQVQARLRPWAEQVLPEAQAHLQGIDLSLLWPQAPSTALSGTVDIHPGDGKAPAWQARLDLSNAQPGPWDQQRLPLEQISARLQQQGRAWVIDPVEARMGGGTLRLKGRWEAGSATPWLAEATLQGVSPQRLHSAAPPALLNGHLALRALGGQNDALGFEVDLSPQAGSTTPRSTLRPSPPPATALAQAQTVPPAKATKTRPSNTPAPGGAAAAASPQAQAQALWSALQLRLAHAQGRWQGGELQLEQLRLELAEARLEGSLQWHTGQNQGRADLKLQTPGLNASLQGHLGADQGQGQWQAQLGDAGALGRWLARLPGLGAQAALLPQQGQGQFDGQWQGGWGAMVAAWQGQTAPRRGQALSLSTRLDLPRLDWAATAQRPALALRQLQLRLSGTLPGDGSPPGTPPIELSLSGEARQGARQARLQVSAHAGPSASKAPGTFNWAARLDELSLNLQDSATAAPWGLRLSAPATLNLSHQAKADLTELMLAPGEARLAHAGVPELSLRWQNSRWAQQKGQARWQTSGQVQDLSLPWIEQLMALAQGASSASLGVSGDLLLNADWSASADPALKAQLRLSRQRGDLRLQADDLPQGVQATEAQRSAGARVAEATLSLDDGALSAAVQWDSERAG